MTSTRKPKTGPKQAPRKDRERAHFPRLTDDEVMDAVVKDREPVLKELEKR